MRIIVNIARVIVGLLFIFSGLIKANDPLGLTYKMQEFFEVWGNSFPSLHSLMLFLNDYALAFSVITITLEVVVGVALLLGWATRFFSWILLLLIIFFTFLTGYAVYSGKIRECGCFGNCIPLTAMQSFIKDIILCVLILIIFFGAKYIRPLYRGGMNFIVLCAAILLVIGFQWYVLVRLPVFDCLPFKKGNNILELRKMPADAISDKMDFKFVYEKKGEKKEFGQNELPDSTWTFVSRKDIVIEKGKNNVPPINDF
ncbi:MAG TPA: BT_3928 family protein, partial [Chitinophagaceae bacterium]|nr:BT_3928 family protein [Chitinophagaceae bacterium]